MKKLTNLILASSLIFIFTELALRVLNPDSLAYYRNVKLLHRYHPDYRVGLTPNADIYVKHHLNLWEGRFTTNSLGYRGSPEVDASLGHLACLGDSLVMGFGVSDQDTFCAGLNGIRIRGREYQAFNLGVDAFGSMGYLKRLQEAADRMPLDIVLLFVSPNDYTMPASLRARGILPDDETDAIEEVDSRERLIFRIQFEVTRHSYALMAAKLALEQLRIRKSESLDVLKGELGRIGLMPSDGNQNGWEKIAGIFFRAPPDRCSPESIQETAVKKTFCEEGPGVDLVCSERETPAPDRRGLPDITRRSYEEMIRLSRERGFLLIPVMLPVHRETLQCGLNGKHSAVFDYALDMRDFFAGRGVKVMDLRPHIPDLCSIRIRNHSGYERGVNVSDILIPGDGHLTERGNAWVARAIENELKKPVP